MNVEWTLSLKGCACVLAKLDSSYQTHAKSLNLTRLSSPFNNYECASQQFSGEIEFLDANDKGSARIGGSKMKAVEKTPCLNAT